MTEATKMPIVGDYKGFRARKSPDSGASWINVFYVCEDGEERCVGQSHDFRSSVELMLRRPLPTWMTKRPEAWSPHSDRAKIASTCRHGVLLSEICYACAESYGSARAV